MNRQDRSALSSKLSSRLRAGVLAAAMMLVLAVVLSACGGSSATGAGGSGNSAVPGATDASVDVVGTEGATAPTGTPEIGRHDQLRPRDGNAVPHRRLDPGGLHRAPVRRQPRLGDEGRQDRPLAGDLLEDLARPPDLDLQPEAGGEIHQRRTARRESGGRQLLRLVEPGNDQPDGPDLHRRILQVGQGPQPDELPADPVETVRAAAAGDLPGLLRDPLAEHLQGWGGSGLQRTDRQRSVRDPEVDPRPEHHLHPQRKLRLGAGRTPSTRARRTRKS